MIILTTPTTVPMTDNVAAFNADAHGSAANAFYININNAAAAKNLASNQNMPASFASAYLLALSPEAFDILNNPNNKIREYERRKADNNNVKYDKEERRMSVAG